MAARSALLCLFALSSLSAASAGTLPDLNTDETALAQNTADGKKFFDQMRKVLDNYNDYTVDSSVYMWRPNPEQVGGGTIAYKKINLLKITVHSKGSKDGAQIVRDREGKIRASGGNHLRFLKMTLEENSRLLQIPNGYNAAKSDLGNLLAKLNESLASGKKLRVTTKPVSVPRLKQNLYLLQVINSAAASNDVCEQIYVDQSSTLPVEWDLFRNGKLYSVATFENFKGNVGLDENAFQL